MFVSAWKVLPFNFIKKPIISALWYAVLIHLIFEPFSATSILISSAIIAISFLGIRFYMALLSPLPLIVSVVLCVNNYSSALPVIAICAGIWMIIYLIAVFTLYHLTANHYYIEEGTNIMKYTEK